MSTNGHSAGVLRQVDRLFGEGTVAGLDEGRLLERFVDRRDEAAFEALVTQFGPMVLGVCKRSLTDSHDVEDAFQATFLILVRKAGTIRDGDRLGNWLYGVAYRVSVRARARRRHSREVAGVEEIAVIPQITRESERVELEAVLDEELSRLPEKYRAPLVLCNLQGETYEEAARRLKCPVGTIRSRTAKAREMLRCRLVRRGFTPSAGALAVAFAPSSTKAAIPPALLRAAVAGSRVLTAKTVTAGVVSASVGGLTREVLRAMLLTKLQWAAGTMAVIAGIVTGAGVVSGYQGKGGKKDSPRAVDLAQVKKNETPVVKDNEEFAASLSGDQVIAALAGDRIKVAKEVRDLTMILFKGGEVRLERYFEAEDRYINAFLSATMAQDERDRLLREEDKASRRLELMVKELYKKGEATLADVKLAEFHRIDLALRPIEDAQRRNPLWPSLPAIANYENQDPVKRKKVYEQFVRLQKNADLESVLKKSVTFSYPRPTPLSEVFTFFEAIGVEAVVEGKSMYVDPEGLKKVNVTMDTKITLLLTTCTIGDALKRVLEPLGLTYSVKNGLIWITAR